VCHLIWASHEEVNNSFTRMTTELATRIFDPVHAVRVYSTCLNFANIIRKTRSVGIKEQSNISSTEMARVHKYSSRNQEEGVMDP
jgi:hypothetical protein